MTRTAGIWTRSRFRSKSSFSCPREDTTARASSSTCSSARLGGSNIHTPTGSTKHTRLPTPTTTAKRSHVMLSVYRSSCVCPCLPTIVSPCWFPLANTCLSPSNAQSLYLPPPLSLSIYIYIHLISLSLFLSLFKAIPDKTAHIKRHGRKRK